MNGWTENPDRMLPAQADGWHTIAFLVISVCALVIFAAVFVNFISCRRGQDVKRERKSVVATGSMILFFFFMYGLIHMRIGVLPVSCTVLRTGMTVVGLAIIVIGCVVNIMGRFRLGRNWANQATVYTDQQLVVSGVYALVRHPLYASLIWMFYGASLVYANGAAFLANSLIFVPFMYYRARLEEGILAREFKGYDAYRKRVGMFFLKPVRKGLSIRGGSL